MYNIDLIKAKYRSKVASLNGSGWFLSACRTPDFRQYRLWKSTAFYYEFREFRNLLTFILISGYWCFLCLHSRCPEDEDNISRNS